MKVKPQECLNFTQPLRTLNYKTKRILRNLKILSLMRTLNIDQVIEDVESDPSSMPDDEIMSISRDDDEEVDFEQGDFYS
ncbi:hypothetical protein Tco_0602147 [Tanacetum coccineum]